MPLIIENKISNGHGFLLGYYNEVLKPSINERISLVLGINFSYSFYKNHENDIYEDEYSLIMPVLATLNLSKKE